MLASGFRSGSSRLILPAFVLPILGFAALASAAVEITNLGPLTYIRNPGKPTVYSTEFPGVAGAGVLRIQNSGVSAAVVRLNGSEVVSPSAFSQQVEALTTPVLLTGQNRIEIELRSKPGSYISVRVTQEVEAEGAAVVGPSGGVVTVGDSLSPLAGLTLEVPPGALQSSVVVIVGSPEDSADPPPPGLESFGSAVQLEPSGVSFTQPVTLRLPLDLASAPPHRQLLLMVLDEQRRMWSNVPSRIDDQNEQMIAELTHFSLYRILHGRYADNSTITWRIASLPSNAPGYTEAQIRAAVKRAFGNWETELTRVGIKFVETTGSAEIVIKWTNAAALLALPVSLGFNSVCIADWNLTSGRLIQCYDSLEFDHGTKKGRWVALAEQETTAPGCTLCADVENALTHEIGHALGLTHIGTGMEPPIMAPSLNPQRAYHSLFDLDVAALRSRYGISPGPCGGNSALLCGTIAGWVESGAPVTIGDGQHDLRLWWSINTYHRGWFYGSDYSWQPALVNADVAVAENVAEVSQIRDASAYDFSTGPLSRPLCDATCAANGVGEFLVVRGTNGYYGVVRVEEIAPIAPNPMQNLYSFVINGSWWFLADGSNDFGR